VLRLFLAFDVPEERRRSIERAVEPLRGTVPAARWTVRESWHVTLTFLGSTPEERLPEVTSLAARSAAVSSPTSSSLTGLGAFPGARRARVLWVGLVDHGVLGALTAALETVFAGAGFPAEDRPWRPHLTVARLKVPGPVDLAGAGEVDATPFPVEEMVLFRSHLKPSGAVYEPLARFRLGG